MLQKWFISVILFFWLPSKFSSKEASSNELVNRRIVGGRIVQRNEFPFHVALRERGKSKSFCGGSIIDNNWILTAAHCLKNESGMSVNPEDIEAVIGVTELPSESNINEISDNVVSITRLVVHSQYHHKSKLNDLALLKTTAGLIRKSREVYTETIPLSSGEQGFLGKEAVVMGYGDQWDGSGFGSKTLRSVQVRILEDNTCRRVYWTFNNAAMMCAGNLGGGRDSCQGDSGGPLIVKKQDGQWIQVGIVSHGSGCARKGFPAVYTRVSTFDWLIHYIIQNY
jgi:secreted trypsin-like serine protease